MKDKKKKKKWTDDEIIFFFHGTSFNAYMLLYALFYYLDLAYSEIYWHVSLWQLVPFGNYLCSPFYKIFCFKVLFLRLQLNVLILCIKLQWSAFFCALDSCLTEPSFPAGMAWFSFVIISKPSVRCKLFTSRCTEEL